MNIRVRIVVLAIIFSTLLNSCGSFDGSSGFWDDVVWNAIENECIITEHFGKCVSNKAVFF
ncbi:MAG: hypothetical protein HY445_00685 [Candidatus Niyogibacteria bacterium]|nr:hypothetical protein [Candidatus Niyogibacteria bacterium]